VGGEGVGKLGAKNGRRGVERPTTSMYEVKNRDDSLAPKLARQRPHTHQVHTHKREQKMARARADTQVHIYTLVYISLLVDNPARNQRIPPVASL
jgi:hypothetical protein